MNQIRRCIPLTLLFCLASVVAAAQEKNAWTPGLHPFVEVRFSPPSGGYGPGFPFATGVEFDHARFMVRAEASYGFMRKTNDADQVPNEHGHTRSAGAAALWKIGRNYFGPGATWGETAVTPYRKYSWAPEIIAGREFEYVRFEASYFRSQREYTDYPTERAFTIGPGQTSPSNYCICSNGVTGVGVDALVAPGNSPHFLIRYSLKVFRFHTSVTDPYNTELTSSQEAGRSTSGSFTAGFVIRR